MENNLIHTVPPSLEQRSGLRKLIERFMTELALKPPLSLDDLHSLSDRLIGDNALSPDTKGWMMVEINNCVWRETVASIPYERRILLLPKCLRHSTRCEAEMDELGLLCHKCNGCSIANLQEKADSLGIMSIVAEGFTSVIGLIQSQVVDTVIGVGCLESLEKAFPLLINNAVPGLAIPLNVAGCKDTDVDYGYVMQMLAMRSESEACLLDYDQLKSNLQEWFSDQSLSRSLSAANDPTSRIAHEWLGGDGKRWRPYLLAATYLALSEKREATEEVRLAALAVECFHKASLIHDDIQDNDDLRYGKPTVNALHGTAMAINVGDILLGEGYRLLTDCGRMELIRAAADAHIALCKGQGMELEWSKSPRPLTLAFVLNIFCNKTVPAFEVSLLLGLICAGDDAKLRVVFRNYSRALGIAYQLLDDMEDFATDLPLALRPSSVLARLCERNPEPHFTDALLSSNDLKAFLNSPANKPLLGEAIEEVRQLAASYQQAALESLSEITNVELKRLLFRVTERILQ